MSDRKNPAPIGLYHDVWRLVLENIWDTDRLADWDSWQHKYDAVIQTEADAVRCAEEMLLTLGDKYCLLRTEAETGEKREAVSEAVSASIYSQMLPGGCGYLRISTFADPRLAANIAEALMEINDCHSLIIDLRDNGGGSIDKANNAVSFFMDRGPTAVICKRLPGRGFQTRSSELLGSEYVITVRDGKSPNSNTINSPRNSNMLGSRPLAILVNGETASAAELFAAILRENKRATIVGAKTGGKGIATFTYELPFGCTLELTAMRFFAPSGHWFGDHQTVFQGIIPDIVVAQPSAPGSDPDEDVAAAMNHLEGLLDPAA